MTSQDLDALLAFVRQHARVCPQPRQWSELWQMLPERKSVGLGERHRPPVPLILAAWWDTTVVEKRERLAEHVRWAAQHGALDDVGKFLRGLPETAWLHEGEGPA